MFSREKRMDVMKLAKEQNWLNRRDFLIFLYSYTSYRGEHKNCMLIQTGHNLSGHNRSLSSRAGVAQVTAAAAAAGVKYCVFAVPHLSWLIGGYL
jgi:hypothetical protein